jgi:Zn-dependent protease/CBS domain-containing protein
VGKSWRIGSLAGIPIGISPLWLVIVGLITWSLGATYYPDQIQGIAPGSAYLLGLVSALLLFASILLHELGHAIVAQRRGVRIEGIDLWLLGGVSKLKDSPHAAGDELRYAIAGPAVTLVIVALFGTLLAVLPSGAPATVKALIEYQFFVNAGILAFNLIPAFPLDGGRILRALIWQRRGDMGRATRAAARIGRGFGYGFIALGLLATLQGAFGGLWLALIGGFVLLAGRAEEGQQEIETSLSGHEARELMAFPAITIAAETSVEHAVAAFFVPYRYHSFPVMDRGVVAGLVTIDRVERVAAPERQQRSVGEITERDPELFVNEHADVAALLRRPAFQRVGRAIVLTERDGVGILSMTEVTRALRSARLASNARAHGSHSNSIDGDSVVDVRPDRRNLQF